MFRLAILGALGFIAYRIGREFVRSVPDDFEPVGVPPAGQRKSPRKPR